MDTNLTETTHEEAAPEELAPEEGSGADEIKRKTHYSGTIVKTTLQGAVVDIGIGTRGVVHISQLQKDPVNRVEDVVQVGQTVDVWVRKANLKKGIIELTMIKPLDLEWREIKKDLVVKGKVTRLEKFGIFVDIGAERPGLVHISEMTHDFIRTPGDLVKEGDEIEVKVLGIDRQKKQIKLSMKALEEKPAKVAKEVQQEADAEDEPEKEVPVPTAMEAALRKAMEGAKRDEASKPKAAVKGKPGKKDQEIESILSRTLEHKVRTANR
jgi:ribosomal protein S1